MLLLLASPLFAPQLLAFPHKTETEAGTVWSVEELDPVMLNAATSDALRRVATSPLAVEGETRPIFITDGGWRWLYLANTAHDAFAITRPINSAIIVNRVEPRTGTIRLEGDIGNERSLRGVLAHEFTHGLIRRHFGTITSMQFPQWKVEGYCDYVADESSLSAAEAAELQAHGQDHPALPYYLGRKRVEARLKKNGGSVEALFLAE